MSTILTRAQYMNACTGETEAERAALHRAYYSQLVNAATIRAVVSYIGSDRLKRSTNPHFNDIPLKDWDRICGLIPLACTFKSLDDYPTLNGRLCAAKEAAQQYRDSIQIEA